MTYAYSYLPGTLAFNPNSTITHLVRVFRKLNVLLAEFEQNLFKHKHWPSTSQDGESLPRKQGIGNPGHGGSKQGFNCTLRERKKNHPWVHSSSVMSNVGSCTFLTVMHALTSHLLVLHLSKNDMYILSNTPVNGYHFDNTGAQIHPHMIP